MLAVPILFFCIYSDPITARRIWVYQYYRLSENVEFFKNVIGIMNVLSKSLILVYTVMPFVCIVKFYKDTKFKVKKFHIKIFALCIFMIITFFYTVFIFGPFRSIMFYNVNPMGLPNGENIYNGYILVPSVSLIITSVMIILLMVFKPFNMFYFEYNKEKDIAKNTQMLTRNISIDLHFYKNMFWSVRQQFELIKAATNMGDYDSVTTYAANGINDIDKQLERLQNTINAMNNDFSLLEDIDIIQCIDSAIAKVKSAPNVSIIKDYDIKSIITVGNEYILTEAFFNLIKNASESFENMDIDDPVITVRIQVEDNVCMIEVSDNGCGIPKSELKYIFNPFYSTKVRTKNSGIGLNYVKEVIKSYHGTIEVISKVNQYTTFQITMPISKRKENSDE